MNDVYCAAIDNSKQKIKNKFLYLVIDETHDIYSRSIINILVGILNGEESKAMLYYTNELLEPPNSENVSKEFLNSLVSFWELSLGYLRFLICWNFFPNLAEPNIAKLNLTKIIN